MYPRDQSWAPHEVYLAEGVGEGLAEEGKRAALRAQAGDGLELSLQRQGLLLGGFWVLMWRSGTWWSSVPCSVGLYTVPASSPQLLPSPRSELALRERLNKLGLCTKAGVGGRGGGVCVCLLTSAICTALCVRLQGQTPDSTYCGGVLQLPAFCNPRGGDPPVCPSARLAV